MTNEDLARKTAEELENAYFGLPKYKRDGWNKIAPGIILSCIQEAVKEKDEQIYFLNLRLTNTLKALKPMYALNRAFGAREADKIQTIWKIVGNCAQAYDENA